MMTINSYNTHKKNIVSNIFNRVGIPSSYSSKLIDDLISILILNMQKNYLKIKNFGSFNLKRKKKRIGRNPKNKINHVITERNVLTFNAAGELTKKVNKYAKK